LGKTGQRIVARGEKDYKMNAAMRQKTATKRWKSGEGWNKKKTKSQGEQT